MKILIITYDFPYPIKSGGQSAQFQIIDYLKINNQLTIISPKAEISDHNLKYIKKLWKGVEIVFVKDSEKGKPKKYPSKKLNLLQRVTNKILFQRELTKQRSALIPRDYRVPLPFNEFIANHLRDNSYDIVQCETTPCLNTGQYIPPNVPKVFIHQELAFIREKDLLKTFSWYDRVVFNRIIKKNKERELTYLSAFDAVVVFNENDKNSLNAELPSLDIEISPYPVDIAEYKNLYVQPYQFDEKIIFLGGQEHYPNYEGIEWFLANVWNKVIQSNPHLKLYIIGKWKKRTIKKYSELPNVEFTGFVENLQAYFKDSIMIVPVRIGSGIRTKILHAFAAGVPVVSTSVGMYGIEYINHEDCVVVDDAIDFSVSLLNLTQDHERLNLIRDNAYKIVLNKFSKELCGEKREKALKKILRINHA